MKFHGNPSSGNHADTFGRTDMMKVIYTFRDYAVIPEKETVFVLRITGLFPF